MFTRFKILEDGENTIVRGNCMVTGLPVEIIVLTKEFKDYYENGKYVQEAFKSLSADKREYFISGVSPEGWKRLYGT